MPLPVPPAPPRATRPVSPLAPQFTLRLLARSEDPAGRPVLPDLLPADLAAGVRGTGLLLGSGLEALDCEDLWVLRRVREELGGEGRKGKAGGMGRAWGGHVAQR
mgnify:CR=1 FL=1